MKIVRLKLEGTHFKETPLNEDIIRFSTGKEGRYIEASIDGDKIVIRSMGDCHEELSIHPVSGNCIEISLKII